MADKRVIGTVPHKPYRPLAAVKGMTADDWQQVWTAYQGFITQVQLIVDRVERRTVAADAAGEGER